MPAPRLVNDKEVLALWRQGLSVEQIAAELEVTIVPVHRAVNRLRDAGYDIPRYERRAKNPESKAIAKRNKAIKAMAIKSGSYATAKHFGLTHQRVSQIAGPTGRPRGPRITPQKKKAS